MLPGYVPPLIGRTWIHALSVPVSELLAGTEMSNIDWLDNTSKQDMNGIIDEFDSVFSNQLGKYSNRKFIIRVKEGVSPAFCEARPIPYALREKVELELDRLVKVGILEPVESSDWAPSTRIL